MAQVYIDRPRTLKDYKECVRRKKKLNTKHILPLTRYVQYLRRLGLGKIPDFDPLDGGVNARILFLFEKPGPKAMEPVGSGFISRNNNDKTAENTFRLMRAANIPRDISCIWNVVPAWNGTVDVTLSEVETGIQCLKKLLAHLHKLEVIVLVGNKAHKAQPLIRQVSSAIIIHSYHPSGRVDPKLRETIQYSWSDARRCLGL